MKIWHIKQDGYIIGSAIGKFKAVRYLEDTLKRIGLNGAVWTKDGGNISAEISGLIYTIEEARE